VRRYETIFILRPDLGENQVKQSLKRVQDIVANGGGELIETDEWGIRELAYRIKRERRGLYVRLDYVATGAVMNEVERNLKLMDESLRHLSVMVQEDADPTALRGEIEARQRRLAEARAAASAGESRNAEEPEADEAAGLAEVALGEEPPASEEAGAAQGTEPPAAAPVGDSEPEGAGPQSQEDNGADQNRA
jgi:small subunit ribosomal protein S6